MDVRGDRKDAGGFYRRGKVNRDANASRTAAHHLLCLRLPCGRLYEGVAASDGVRGRLAPTPLGVAAEWDRAATGAVGDKFSAPLRGRG